MRSLARSDAFGEGWPLRNVWLGVSAEDQHWADIRIPALLDTPAAVRFVSAEPLIGAIDLHPYWTYGEPAWGEPGREPNGIEMQPLTRKPGIDWLIAGGESGPGARPCYPGWLRSLRTQCGNADVPFFCKQVGSVLGRSIGAGPKGGDWDAWPEDLRVREFPAAAEQVTA
jgi:protein gp37